MMNKKYQLLRHDTMVRDGRTLYRIQAVRQVRLGVQKGALGGYVEREANLSHEGECWIFQEACVYEEARLTENACLYDQATLRGKAKLGKQAMLREQAIVQGEANVGGYATVQGHVIVDGSAEVKGKVNLIDFVHVGENARVQGDSLYYLLLQGTSILIGNTLIQGYGVFPDEEAILEAGSFWVEEDE